ncbi:unnamed protein product [Closterium sp. NIES-53]
MAPGQQASARDMVVEWAEDEEEEVLKAATTMEAAEVAAMAMTTRTTDTVADGSTANVIFAPRADTYGAIATNSLMDGLLLKAKRVEEQGEEEEEVMEAVAVAEVTLHSLDYWVIDSGATYSMTPRADLLTELEPSPVKHVISALGQQAELKGMGKAMFKGPDGKIVGLKNVLWVPNLAANLISVRRLQKAGMDTSSKGAKTFTARLGEFLIKDFSMWLKKNGIRHSLTMLYSPAMNGIAERANRTITKTACGLLIEAGLPNYFWPDVVRSACVSKNRALSHVGADKWVPYVEWIGRKPKVDMLRVFGCMCMALVPKHHWHKKLGANAIWAVHLGMAQNSKGWHLWDPFTKKFLVSRDYKFMENLM